MVSCVSHCIVTMCVQAWPPPASLTQPMQDAPPEQAPDRGPAQQGGHGVSAAALPEAAGMPPTTRALDAATQELLSLVM